MVQTKVFLSNDLRVGEVVKRVADSFEIRLVLTFTSLVLTTMEPAEFDFRPPGSVIPSPGSFSTADSGIATERGSTANVVSGIVSIVFTARPRSITLWITGSLELFPVGLRGTLQ